MTTFPEFDIYQLATRDAEPVQALDPIDDLAELARLIEQISDPQLADKIRKQLQLLLPDFP